jgi:hypothetical protein
MKGMGVLAAEWVLDAVQARERRIEKKAKFHKAPPELVVRMSSAPPPQKPFHRKTATEAKR